MSSSVGISTAGEKAISRISSGTVIAIALAAAILSFTGLRSLAVTAGFTPELAWLFPLIVDGLTLVGSLGVVHATLTGMRVWYPWALTLTGVVLSVWGNVTIAAPTAMSRIVHAVPPIVLALALEALLRVYRHRLAMQQAAHQDTTDLVQQTSVRESLTDRRPARPSRDVTDPLTAAPQRSIPPRTDPQPEPVDISTVPSTPASPEPSRPVPVDIGHGPAVTGLAPVIPDLPAPTTAVPQPTTAAPVTPEASGQNRAPHTDGPDPVEVPAGGTVRDQVAALLAAQPDITPSEAARTLGKDRSNISKILKDLRADDDTASLAA